ncbi:CAAX amino terminal protease self- immunity [Tsuneonella dongtanensis]|uniref:CAAX amino terminal protease self-immunity n=1 Tax=Tsuneonella dongtanensis TaxID=692370 RepID=A0A1B2AFA1_9SPHN|nr:CPBP family intramembrane glutamic endopeptidase [Tsuneonella dongtanensis]ANY20820.1 CAAX amino terminal protease self- immunity [Tsuneonella dongtanensis]
MADDDAEAIPRSKVSIALGFQAAVFVGLGAACWHFSGRDLSQFVSGGPIDLAVGVGFGLAMIALAAVVFRLSPTFLETTTRLQSKTARLIGPERSWPFFVWISICAGIGEEAFFRGGLLPVIGDAFGTPVAVVATALAFALFHMAKPPIAALLFAIGIVFGAVYWLTGSLLTVIVGHVVYDIWAIETLRREAERLGLYDTPETLAAS